eukprot:TRINITY_DN182_c0_g1_i1.p1 TRINITY_DN182_c0_g1~~TRINITY_DN182_c0_g1_i1.p1  ORF type:complete len:1186 (+),score=325.03 TRINITY_DN182_c0_g1_i1:1699-5256(+)
MIDDIPDLMGSICDPNGLWGHLIAKDPPKPTTGVHHPCPDYLTETPCTQDQGCVWSDVGGVCVNSPCLMHCDQADCKNDKGNNCTWDPTNATCSKAEDPTCPCKYDTPDAQYNEQQCNADARCTWDANKCIYDECKTKGAGCTAVGQSCTDPNKDPCSPDDYVCECIPPTTVYPPGTPPSQQPAECRLDECVATCPTCANDTCTSKGQECNDPNPTVTHHSDWTCTCPPPSTGKATAAAADCKLDECVVDCPTCEKDVCKDAGQTCLDPNTSADVKSDWMCICPPPSNKTNVGGPADCEVDECKLHGDICTNVGQTCTDPNKLQQGDWKCDCVPPANGTMTAGPAICLLDECEKDCPTCEKDVCKNAPTGEQTCNDPDKTATSTGDWTCECIPPLTGLGHAAPAHCKIDECIKVCPTCANDTCSSQNQTCHDPNTDATSLSDWVCKCPPPATDIAVAAAATPCEDDECHDPNNEKVCTAAGQICVDDDKKTKNTWECECVVPPAVMATRGLMLPAHCVYPGECETDPNAKAKCTDLGFVCDDPDPMTQGDWLCMCAPPATGTSVLMANPTPPECKLDECVITCPTCAQTDTSPTNVCAAEGQKCVDDKQSHTDLGDWTCECIPPQTGTKAVAAPAKCQLDECVVVCPTCAQKNNGDPNTCTDVGQTCEDPDKSVDSTLDWTCTCVDPGKGVATAKPAECVCNECLNNTVCLVAGQTCYDKVTTCPPNNDFQCECPPPTSGVMTGSAADCTVDECVENGATCTAVGQTCKDPNTTKLHDWECWCPPPSVGIAITQQAKCVLDECVQTCPTCAGTTCSDANQECEDPNTSVQSTNDWLCKCPPPSTNVATGHPAKCEEDECDTNGWKCTVDCRAGSLDCQQTCFDPNTSVNSTDDWKCVCPPPSSDFAVAKAAECTNDPCKHDNEQTCLSDPQGCEWTDLPTPKCTRKPCLHDKQSDCEADPMCDWSTGSGTSGNLANQMTFEKDVSVKPFDGLTCKTPGSWKAPCSCSTVIGSDVLPGATVDIEDGYLPGKDTLTCVACQSLGLTAEWHSVSGMLTISKGTAEDLAKAIASIEFSTAADNSGKRRITWNYGHGFFSSHTGHYYHFYPKSTCAGGACKWSEAQAQCELDANQILGLRGYLITITSDIEDEVARMKLEGQGWMGASDVREEGKWNWVTGPEGAAGGCV